jgi:alpha-L-fucosidase
MKVNGDSIYGTTASPFGPLPWGRCTKKASEEGTLLYLHVFDWPADGELPLPGLNSPVTKAYLMADRRGLKSRQTDSRLVVSLPSKAPDENNSVVVLEVSGPLEMEVASSQRRADGSLVLGADSAYLHNNEGARQMQIAESGGRPHIGYWTDVNAWVEWAVTIDQPGEYEIWADLAVESEQSRFRVGIPGQENAAHAKSTGGYYNFEQKALGSITVKEPGEYSMRIHPDTEHWQPINLRQLVLKPE